MQLEITRYCSGHVNHNAKEEKLLVDASELNLRRFDRLYDDACDVGLALVNPRTGNVTRWSLLEEKSDGEGEVLWWVLVATPESIRKQPELKGYKLLIYND